MSLRASSLTIAITIVAAVTVASSPGGAQPAPKTSSSAAPASSAKATASSAPAPSPAGSATAPSGPAKYGALAIDRANGFYYGFSHDQATLAEAEQRALDETKKRGGKGSVVVTWAGVGCTAYRTVAADVGTAYGWGIAATAPAADAIATREATARSNGKPVTNHVWACNDAKSGELRTIFDEAKLRGAKPAPFEENGLYGYKRADGSVLARPQFKRAMAFDNDGLALVFLDGPDPAPRNYLDLDGKLVFAKSESGIKHINNGLFATGTLARQGKDNRLGLFDRKSGKQLIPNEYYDMTDFSGAPAGKTRIYRRKLVSCGEVETGRVKDNPTKKTCRVVLDATWMDVDLADRSTQDVKTEKFDFDAISNYFL